MEPQSNPEEALRLVSDWAKWLVTIQTGAIALIGSRFAPTEEGLPTVAKVFGTLAVICFLISILVAAILLLTLPEIGQYLQPETNIWLTQDSVAGRLFHMNTQSFAIVESVFFGLGLVFFVCLIIATTWLPRAT